MAWTPDYATSGDLKAYARIPDTVDDVQVALAVAAASRSVDLACNRQFGVVAAAEVRYYQPTYERSRCRWVVEIDDLMSTADMEVDGVAYDADLHRLEPRNAPVRGRPWTELVITGGGSAEVAITALWGWTAVPAAIEQATLLQANRLLARRDSPFGVAGSPDQGSEIRLAARVDPDVKVALAPYIRWWGAR